MAVETGKEQTILVLVGSLEKELGILNMKVDNLVRRVPPDSKIPPMGIKEYNNVFDEIICRINQCRSLVGEVNEKILEDICKKVQ